MSEFFVSAGEATRFDAAKASKADLARGKQLFVGLNCFEPGQSQHPHTHADADKFYFLISGKARMTVGSETQRVGPGGDAGGAHARPRPSAARTCSSPSS